MKKNLLIVTDHSTHSASNSLYELSDALRNDMRCDHVWVASKGHKLNYDFFSGIEGAPLFAAEVQSGFSYDPTGEFILQHSKETELNEVGAILVRMPQPLDKNFLLSLEKLIPQEKIVNHPSGTILTSSKEFLLKVAHHCPDPKLINSAEEAIELSKEYEIVLKPLYSYGGRGIIRLSQDAIWLGIYKHPVENALAILQHQSFPMLSMRYLPNVAQGDKRTIVVNGQIMGSAVRMPAPGSWICNVAQGGHAFLSDINEEERKIEEELTPLLQSKGVIFYGFDTLVDDNGKRVLSEINTLSIGGLGPIEEMSGRPVLKRAAELLWNYWML